MRLSVIIVNYNVRAFLQQALLSLYRSIAGTAAEIFVVDNNSVDGSLEMLRQEFPEVKIIANNANIGFAKANNQALTQARGDYIWLLNPDTLIQEDTVPILISYMDDHPKVGLAGCRILNAEGTLQLPCRRSFPTPWVAFTKLSGLARLFPHSKLFGRYNLTYQDPEAEIEVDAVSGSCMFARAAAVREVGQLDESFFMYGEDLDWAYRFHAAGWEVRYTPVTSIIHYKGESSKIAGWDSIGNFYKAMDIFSRKHFKGRFWRPLHWMLRLGILLRYFGSLANQISRNIGPIILDISGILIVLGIAVFIKFQRGDVYGAYAGIGAVYLLIWLISLKTAGSYSQFRYSISRAIVGVALGFLLNVTLTFFFNQFAFSRQVLIMTFLGSVLWIPGWRLMATRRSRKIFRRSPLDFRKTLVVGDYEDAKKIFRKLNTHLEFGYQPVGIVLQQSYGTEDTRVLGDISDLPELIMLHAIKEVIFASEQINLKRLFDYIPRLGQLGVNFKLVPGNLTFIIGKSSVEDLRDIQLVEMRFDYFRPGHRSVKRISDIFIAAILSLTWWPVTAIQGKIKHFSRKDVYYGAELLPEAIWESNGTWVELKSRLPLLRRVWQGKFSLVGAPWDLGLSTENIKPGLVSLEDIRGKSQLEEAERVKLLNYYLHNQSFLFDLEIFLKAISGR